MHGHHARCRPPAPASSQGNRTMRLDWFYTCDNAETSMQYERKPQQQKKKKKGKGARLPLCACCMHALACGCRGGAALCGRGC